MDIDGLGDEIIARLEEEGLVDDVSDLYRLDAETLSQVTTGRVLKDGTPGRLGETVAAKLVAGIEASKDRPLARLLFGLGIRHVGATVAEMITRVHPSLDDIVATAEEDLASIEGVGPAIAGSLRAFFDTPPNHELIERLRVAGVRMADEAIQQREQTLAGTTWVLTGALERFTRDEASAGLKALGAKVSGSVSKKTSFVVVGADPGSKYTAAVELGVPVLSEDDLARTLETGLPPETPA